MPQELSNPIVLASGSAYRRQLLGRLLLPFEVVVPGVDEAVRPGEAPGQLATRLALSKAEAVARERVDAVVIGSDQVAELDGQAIGKPAGHEAALQQLLSMQGRTVVFHTALAVLHARQQVRIVDNVPTEVRFRSLDAAALDAYLRADQPYDCAGAAKIESLGICLVESVRSDDPTALIGLPLIRLVSMLRSLGVHVPPP